MALATIRLMTKGFSIRIGAVTPIADVLFKTCNDHSWPALERSKLVIFLSGGTLEVHPEDSDIQLRASALVVVLRPLVARIRVALLEDHEAAEQSMFPFPPASQPASGPAFSRRRQS